MSDLTRRAPAVVLLLGALVSAAPAAAQRPRTPPPSPLSPALATPTDDLRRAVSGFLADSLLEGRAAGSRGGLLAARYLAAQFEALGLRPGASDGSYYQPVPLIAIESHSSIVFGAGRETFAPRIPEDLIVRVETTDSQISVDGELVFAGFGIEAPEHGWDDYKGVPQTGRIVMVVGGDPQRRDSTLMGNTRFGEVGHKIAQAGKAGAAGVIVVSAATDEAWARLAGASTGEVVRVQTAGRSPVRFVAWVREPMVRRMLQAANRDFDLLLRRAAQKDFSPITTGINAAIGIESRTERRSGVNVIAKLAGADSATGQAVVFVAPYTGPAHADAAATLTAAAAGIARFGSALGRSVVLIATAGRAGAEHYVTAPAVNLRRTAAVLFIEDPPADNRTMQGIGAARSTLGEIMRAAARADSLPFTPVAGSDGELVRASAYPFFEAGRPTAVVPADPTGATVRLLIRTAWTLTSSPGFPEWLPEFQPR